MSDNLFPVALSLEPTSSPRGTGYITGNGKTSISSAQAAAAITRVNARWSPPVGGGATSVTYAFRASGAPSSPYGGFSQFNGQQMEIAQAMLAAWSDVANIDFVRVGSGKTGDAAYSNSATMLLGNYVTGPSDVAGFAYYPGSVAASAVSGDVWINSNLSYEIAPTLGNYGAQTFLHEIGHALGLSHPGDYNAGNGVAITYANSANYYEDSRQYSVMSYFSETSTGAIFQGTYAFSPLLDDIAAIQSLYGARTQRTGDTIYGFSSNTGIAAYSATSADTKLIFAAWDSGGIDTFDFSGYSQAQRIDLRAGQFSNIGGLTGNVSIYYDVTIENARGGSGADTIIGNAANNILYGNGGSDTIYGGAGDDSLYGGDADDFLDGGSGTNLIDGGAGSDTLLLQYDPFDYMVYTNPDGTTTVARGTDLKNTVTSIESVRFRNTVMTYASFVSQGFDGLRYIASYGDLISSFGSAATASAGFAHFRDAGRAEGRLILFNPLQYAASNPDLARGLRDNIQALEMHYISSGYREGRSTNAFNALNYAASNTDLIQSYGDDETGLTRHYVQFGVTEGRATSSFDPYAYALANRDLIANVGIDARALTLHYILNGFTQGRAVTSSFSALQYAASNLDLYRVLGTDIRGLELHYLQDGIREGRSTTSFNAYAYVTANTDLYPVFGFNVEALTQHYLSYGANEGRSTSNGFDAYIYAASNPDLMRGIGANEAALYQHYLQSGRAEGRPTNLFDPYAYAIANRDLIAGVGINPQALALHYIQAGSRENRPTTSSFSALQYAASNLDLFRSLGTDVTALELHYLTNGIAEGRPTNSFNAFSYAIANPDLYRALGLDVDALTRHYLYAGIQEGRAITSGFNPLEYAASNLDLAQSLGTDARALTLHYLQSGRADMRPIDSFNTSLYIASNIDLARLFGADLDAGRRHYIISGITERRPVTGFDAASYMLGNNAEWGRGLSQATSDYLVNRGYQLANPFGRIGTDQTGSHVISTASTTQSNFATIGDRDWYQFTITSTQNLTMTLVGITSIDTYLYLHDSSGRLITSDDDSNGALSSRITRTLASGTYYIVAGTFLDNYSGQYRLTLSSQPATSTAGSINEQPSSSTVTVKPSSGTYTDTLSFSGPSTLDNISSDLLLPDPIFSPPVTTDPISDPFARYAYLLGANPTADQIVLGRQDSNMFDTNSGGLAASSVQASAEISKMSWAAPTFA